MKWDWQACNYQGLLTLPENETFASFQLTSPRLPRPLKNNGERSCNNISQLYATKTRIQALTTSILDRLASVLFDNKEHIATFTLICRSVKLHKTNTIPHFHKFHLERPFIRDLTDEVWWIQLQWFKILPPLYHVFLLQLLWLFSPLLAQEKPQQMAQPLALATQHKSYNYCGVTTCSHEGGKHICFCHLFARGAEQNIRTP